MHQTKPTLAGLLRAGGSSCLITTGNDPEFNVPFAFTKTELPKELKTTWICLALSLKLFFPWQPVQPGLSQTTRQGHCLQLCEIQTLNSNLIQNLQLSICFHLRHTYFRCFTDIYPEGYEQPQEQRYKLSSKGQKKVDSISPKVCYFFPVCFQARLCYLS